MRPSALKSLTEVYDRRAIRRPCRRLEPGAPAVLGRLFQNVATGGMVRQSLDVLVGPPRMLVFERRQDSRVQLTPRLLQKRGVCYLICKRVLESIRRVRRETRLYEELGGLKAAKSGAQRILVEIADRAQQRVRDFVADRRGDAKQRFVCCNKLVDAGRDHCLHRPGKRETF